MRKIIITGMALAMLALPAAASMASSFNDYQATANDPTSNDGIGFCVSAGQANYQAAGYTLDRRRRSVRARSEARTTLGRRPAPLGVHPGASGPLVRPQAQWALPIARRPPARSTRRT